MVKSVEVERAVISVLGLDKLGTVATLCAYLREHNASLETTSAARLGNMFGLQALFVASSSKMAEIRDTYESALSEYVPVLRPAALRFVEFTAEPCAVEPVVGVARYDLDVYAYDDVGIVADIGTVLADVGVDIAHLGSCQFPAPESGLPLYVVQMKVDVAKSVAMKSVRGVLYEMEQSRGWDIDFRPESPVEHAVPSRPFPPSRDAMYYDCAVDSRLRDVVALN